jgi:hypothetical protein
VAWNWDAFEIVALYWLENVVIGLLHLLKMATCDPDPHQLDMSALGYREADIKEIQAGGWKVDLSLAAMKSFFGLFFLLHYGGFCYGHGTFVFLIFDKGSLPSTLGEAWQFLEREHLFWGVAALLGSHLVSYFTNFIGRGEFRRVLPNRLMLQPYARIAVLHVAIIFGGFIVELLDSPLPLLVALIAGKTALDLAFHFHERQRNAPAGKKPSHA